MNAYILAHVKIILRQILHRLKSWQSIQIKMAELEDIELTSHYKKKKKKRKKKYFNLWNNTTTYETILTEN